MCLYVGFLNKNLFEDFQEYGDGHENLQQGYVILLTLTGLLAKFKFRVSARETWSFPLDQ